MGTLGPLNRARKGSAMSQISEAAETTASGDLQALARAHLMLAFSSMAEFMDQPLPMLERGEGCHVLDDAGNRFIDGLSGLYCASLGHSFGDEIGRAAHEQMRTLPYAPNVNTAHPRSVELAARVAGLAPEGLERVFFVSGGSEAVESAWKLAQLYHRANGEPQRRKAIAREGAYHGATLGALSLTGLASVRKEFEPLTGIPVRHISNTNAYRHPEGGDPERFCRFLLAELESVIDEEGPETIAMLIAEPVQNAGGALVPPPGYWQGVREICDRHGILLCSDEIICAFGRMGAWFACERFGFEPDLITFAKGFTGGHFSMGGVLLSDQIAEPFLDGRVSNPHGFTYCGHPVGCAVALAAIDIYEREGVLENVSSNEASLGSALDGLRDIPIVGDVRGMGYLWSIELVRDQASKEVIAGKGAEWLLRDVLSAELSKRGLICRVDSRADPVLTLSPPLVAGPGLIDEIAAIMRGALEVTAEQLEASRR